MDKERRNKGKWSDLLQIYGMMFKYWHIMVAGLVSMLLYALFSGISITLVIPLFDYVFNPAKTNLLYLDPTSFLNAVGSAWAEFSAAQGGLLSINSLNDLAPFWESLQEIMLRTDSLALLYVLCGFVLVTILLKNLFYFIQRVLFVKLRGNTIRDVRNMMFRRYMDQSLEFYNRSRVGDSIVRMVNDVDIVSEQFIRSLLEGLRDVVTILVYMRIALLLNSSLFVYSIIILPAFTLLVGFLGKKIKKYSRRIQAQMSSMFSTVEEALNSMKIVKAFRREESEYEGFSRINRTHLKMWKKERIYAAMNVPLSELNTVITGVIVIIIGGKMILEPGSTFSLGDFTAFLFALFSMLHPLKSLTKIYTDVKKALVSLGRISVVMNQRSSIQDAPDAVEKHGFDKELVFENVSFYYDPGKAVLQNIDLKVRKGEKVAFVGASGGGKSTLANLFNRMYDVREGRILLDGIDIRKIRVSDLRRLFGVVTQDSILFTRSIRENIAYGSLEEVTDEQVENAARIAHAEDFILSFPEKYDEILQTKGVNLSGGQRQRLCIARAIVGDPPILIFDEATSALDTESEKMVQEAIDEATQNRTVIMIAHRLSTVLKADRIVVLEQGRIVGIGSHDELLRDCGRYQVLYNMQFENGGKA
ncbi:MAG: ABC transporter ATP-binding protein [Candidatus Syntrophosphaera sp.]